jgi:4-amino-4-deoxy-L-arabinose transferase-like glycosyltransferase
MRSDPESCRGGKDKEMRTPAVQPVCDREREESSVKVRHALWALIGVSTILRLVWAASLGAAYDEPYYFQYIQHPALSYFDHPPMVALVGASGLALTGDPFSVFGLRLGFIVLFAGSTWLMARLTARFYGPNAGVLAALALNISGYFGMAVATIAQPDGPLLFFWLLTLDRLAVALDDPDRLVPWLGVGVAWGGAMLSKYHAVLLPAGVLLHMVFWPQARRCLRKPGPYLAAAIGLILFAPVIAWNATHNWASFLFQGGRATFSHQLRIDHLGAALGAESLYLFPWLWIAMVVLLVKLIRRGPRAWDKDESFLICQAAPALVLFHAISVQRWIMPYWPLFGFVALMPLLGRAWAEGLKTCPAIRRRWITAAAIFPVLLAALVSAQANLGLLEDSQGRLLGMIAPKNDPTADMICWDEVAGELRRRGLLTEPRTFLFTDSWDRSAGLALATRGKAPVVCYHLEPRSYSFWSRPEDWVGRDGIFIESVRVSGALSHYKPFFTRYESIGTVRIHRRGIFVREVYLYRGTNQTWPFPFDGRFREREERGKTESGISEGVARQAFARGHDTRRR